ncbi:MAG: Hint domain-containing protein [Actinomycetota bacterium]|nr:Hint domain-containing protein [Actinomycetota bacterium]MDQ2956511.1 Hint domain-containing protein [Actinomycetota bacterium]
MPSITDDQLRSIHAAVQRCSDGVRRALHPANPEDAAAIKAFLELTGKTPQSHPGLYSDVDSLSANGETGPEDHESQVLDIVDRGRDANGRATARVWHLDRDGRHTSGSLALALDADTGKPVALGFANKVGGGLTPAATRSEDALPAPDKMTTVGFFHSQSAPEATPKFGMVAQTAAVGQQLDAVQATVTDPITKKGHSAIQIGLGRPNPSNDCDYFYTQDTNDSPELVVPFTGTVNTQQPLAMVGQDGHFTGGLLLTTQLYSVAGPAYVAHNSAQTLTSQLTANTSTNVVTWAYPYDPQDSPSAYTSLMYGSCASANNNNLTAFYFAFQIPVDNPVLPTYDFNVCSTDWPGQPSVNCVQIPPLSFWWHCVAEGTEVTLHDGSTVAIEHVDNTKRVRTGHHGGSLGVEATTRGRHAGRAVQLETKGGRSLLLTPGHPVATPDGLMCAGDLKVKDTVITADGVDEVASVETVESDVHFANLKLVDEHDRARGLAGTVGTFIANGIVVGDFESMTQLHHQRTHSLDYMLPSLPERYHTDYASTLSHIARDNARYGANF